MNKIRNEILNSGNRNKSATNTSISSPAVSLSNFEKITIEDLKRLTSSIKKKSSKLDPIPTTILMKVIDSLYPFILHIVNSSISKSEFPNSLKYAHVTPILKKKTLL